MFRIGEFSKLTQVSIRMLRYYDEAGLLKPETVDKFTGYRLYSTLQIPRLQQILLLRDMKFNIAEIAAALEQWNSDSMIKDLTEKSGRYGSSLKARKNESKRSMLPFEICRRIR